MPENTNKRPGSWERSYSFEIDPISRRHLRFFISNELAYYNTLVNDMNMRLRAFPEELCNMKGSYERLWNTLAFMNGNLRKLAKVDLKNWPELLRNTATFLPTKDGKVVVDDKMMLFFDALVLGGKIHPAMRRSLASELLKASISQAESLAQANRSASGQMRTALHMLLPAETAEKTHVQLMRELVTINWNSSNKSSEITIPYTDRPLTIKDHNIADEKFNLMVIKPSISSDSQWQVVLYNTQARYLLDLRDSVPYVRNKRKVA